ncbi:unnamed protein product, partial [Rotaria sp. Silwood2]
MSIWSERQKASDDGFPLPLQSFNQDHPLPIQQPPPLSTNTTNTSHQPSDNEYRKLIQRI